MYLLKNNFLIWKFPKSTYFVCKVSLNLKNSYRFWELWNGLILSVLCFSNNKEISVHSVFCSTKQNGARMITRELSLILEQRLPRSSTASSHYADISDSLHHSATFLFYAMLLSITVKEYDWIFIQNVRFQKCVEVSIRFKIIWFIQNVLYTFDTYCFWSERKFRCIRLEIIFLNEQFKNKFLCIMYK